MKSVKYGIRIKGSNTLLKCHIVLLKGNGEAKEICELNTTGDQEWFMNQAKDVEEVLQSETKWYQSSFERPVINYPIKELEIVEITEMKKAEIYTGDSIYENIDSYHRRKVEEALALEEKMKERENEIKNNVEIQELQQMERELEIYESPISDSKQIGIETPVAVAQKSKTVKAKVKCLKDIPKELGSVRLKTDPVFNCFKEGKHYLAYVKNEKLFILNEDKVPEFICNAPSESDWSENSFFKKHFMVEEYIN